MSEVGTFLPADPGGPHHAVTVENATVHFCTNFIADANDQVAITNSIFACVTKWSCATTSTNSSVFLNSDAGLFQSAGAGRPS